MTLCQLLVKMLRQVPLTTKIEPKSRLKDWDDLTDTDKARLRGTVTGFAELELKINTIDKMKKEHKTNENSRDMG